MIFALFYAKKERENKELFVFTLILLWFKQQKKFFQQTKTLAKWKISPGDYFSFWHLKTGVLRGRHHNPEKLPMMREMIHAWISRHPLNVAEAPTPLLALHRVPTRYSKNSLPNLPTSQSIFPSASASCPLSSLAEGNRAKAPLDMQERYHLHPPSGGTSQLPWKGQVSIWGTFFPTVLWLEREEARPVRWPHR